MRRILDFLTRASRDPRDDRGDVPGWVLITLVTVSRSHPLRIEAFSRYVGGMSGLTFRPGDQLSDRGRKKSWRPPLEPAYIVMYVSLAFVAAALILVAVGGGFRQSEPTPYDPDNAGEAQAQCRDLVEGSLKAPATAEFGELSAAKLLGEWTVTGYVDAENSFGAMLRNNFQCTVRVVDGTIERRLDYLE
jgi:hypothetical protein